MLKPERVTFSADDDKFNQFTNNDELDSVLNDSLVHYSTDFKKTDHQETTSLKNSNSLDQLSSSIMSSQEQQQQVEREPSNPSSLISTENTTLNETNLRPIDALTLQQLAIGSPQNLSNINEADTTTSPTHSISYADVQKEIDRVRRMKYGRTYSSPTSSLCSRLTINPFNGSNNNIDLSSITQSVHFIEQSNQNNNLPFSSTYITSIPESIVPASASSSSNVNHFMPINYIESPSLEDREVFETLHTKSTSIPGIAIRQSVNSLNRTMSTSETDLLASLERSASKQDLDNQSEHGTNCSGVSDDMIFAEWDKERNLFQDYINSLRTEIRVLLQERAEYQKNIETINNNLSEHKRLNSTQVNTDHTRYDLLQKSLEEKNSVLEQLQKEYETMKEKNTNLSRKISVLRCDSKSQAGVIDELKQKIAELTVDVQNHAIIKRRLEVAMMNLESDYKIIDAERMRLTNDIKDTQLTKQELEKLLQQANVKIAEQGSTIEMLRSDNIQVRSQLSATQRRMLQEKQQVMDYLRQIESDLVEKEQIKQRESFLRKDYEKLQLIHQQDRQDIEKLNLQINQDKQKLDQLEEERLQLFKTIQNMDDNKVQLENELGLYKSSMKCLYTHFKLPFDSIQSIDQLVPMLEDRYRTEQLSQARIHQIPHVKSTSDTNHEHETEEVRQLREDLISMNTQLKQLNDANQAWQQYQQNQIVLLCDRLNLNNIDNVSFDDIVQQIENRFNLLNNQLIELQDTKKTDDVLRKHIDEGQTKDTQTENNVEFEHSQKDESAEIPIRTLLLDNNLHEEEHHRLQENVAALTTQNEKLAEANQAWQQYHQTQLDSFRNKLQSSLHLETDLSSDDMAQNIGNYFNELQNEREHLQQQLCTSEKLIDDIRSQFTDDKQRIQETFTTNINELNQKLVLLKQQNDQLETEKYILNQELQNQTSTISKLQRNTPTIESTFSETQTIAKQMANVPIHATQIHRITPLQSASPSSNEHEQELQQLRETVALLTAQAAQLDEANRAWQLYQHTQTQDFRSKFNDYLSTDVNASFDSMTQQLIDYLSTQQEDFNKRYRDLQRELDELRTESTTNLETIKESYINAIDELNKELLTTQNQCNELDVENQRLNDELVKRDAAIHTEQSEKTFENLSAAFIQQPLGEDAIHSQSTNIHEQEVHQLRETVALLTSQVVQLEEANSAWQNYQNAQIELLREKLREHIPSLNQIESGSLDFISQQILNHLGQLNVERENLIRQSDLLKEEIQIQKQQFERPRSTEPTQRIYHKQPQIHSVRSSKSASPLTNEHEQELQQLRETVALLTSQVAQLEEANRAWQLFHQTQLDTFRNTLQEHLPIDDSFTLDQAAQHIVHEFKKERQDAKQRCEALEKVNEDLRSETATNLETIKESYVNAIEELNKELSSMKEQYDQNNKVDSSDLLQQSVVEDVSFTKPLTSGEPLDQQESEEIQQLRESLVSLTSQLDETNRAWQQYQQAQSDTLRHQLQHCFSIDYNNSFHNIAQQIVDQVTREREDFNEKYQSLEKENDTLRSDLTNNMESIRESYVNTVNELNQELLIMKEKCEDYDIQNQFMSNELGKRSMDTDERSTESTMEKVPINNLNQSFEEVPTHSSSVVGSAADGEVEQLRESVALLTAQCAQLDEANRAWQAYHHAQVQDFRSKLQDYVQMDENGSLESVADQIIEQISKERADSYDRYQTLEKINIDLQMESTNNLETIKESYVNSIDELNSELMVMKQKCEELNTEEQELTNEMEKGSRKLNPDESKQNIEKVSSNLFSVPFEAVPIDSSGTNIHEQEPQQLRETVALLTSQVAQLEEANRAWQLFHQTQLDTFRNTLQEHLPIDDSFTLDQAAQHIVHEFKKERQDAKQQCEALEKVNEDLRSETATNLETIKESYVNAIEELNEELSTIKEQCELLYAEKELLSNKLEARAMILNEDRPNETNDSLSSNTLREIPLETSAPTLEQENEEVEQLRSNFAILTSQYAQLNEANRAWQEFHQSQINDFRAKIQNYIDIDDDLNFEAIAQRIVDEITNEREYSNERYQTLEKAHNDLQSESLQGNKEYLLLKEQYGQVLQDKKELMNQLENQSSVNNQENDAETMQLLNTKLIEQQMEMSKIQDNFNSIMAQLEETNNSWQQSEQSHLNLLKTILPNSSKTSVEDVIQEIGSYVNHLTKEIASLEDKAILNREENQLNDNQLEQQLTVLQNQCTQLDTANRAWQLFYDNQIDLLKDKFKDYINVSNDQNFDEIIHLIAAKFEQQNQLNLTAPLDITQDDTESLRKTLTNSQENEQLLNQQILNLQQECQNLDQQLRESQYSIDSLKVNLQMISNENEQLKQHYNELQQKNNLFTNANQSNTFERQSSPDTTKSMIQREVRRTPVQDVQVHRITPVRSTYSPNIDEEICQLRTELAASSAHCSQLEEANRAWQQFHQNQLEILRHKLQNLISLDDNFTLEQLTQQILIHFEQLENNKQNENQLDSDSTIDSLRQQLANYQSNESLLSQNLERLNEKMLDAHRECEEVRENNADLISSKQQIEHQLHERQQQNDLLSLENQQLQCKLDEMENRLNQLSYNTSIQRIDSPRENIAIHNMDLERNEEILRLRSDLATTADRCSALEEANSAWQNYQNAQIELLREKLREHIPSLNQIESGSLDFISQQILNHLGQLNVERENLIRQSDLLKEEIQIQKQQFERPRSTEPTQRIYHKQPQIHSVRSSKSASPLTNEHEQELQQLRETVALLTSQVAQLEEANRAWQLFHQTQLDTFRNTLQEHLPIDDSFTLDQAAQHIVHEFKKERQDAKQRCEALEKVNEDLRSETATNLETIKESYVNAIEELNKELSSMKEQYDQNNKVDSSDLLQQSVVEDVSFTKPLTSGEPLDQQESEEIQQLRESLVSLTSQLDETNRAWQQYQQAQSDTLRHQLQHCFSIDYNNSFHNIAQQIVDQVTREREDFNEKYQSLEKENDTLRSDLTNNMESIRESYVNTVNELNQELLIMKEKCEDYDIQNQFMSNELGKRSMDTDERSTESTMEKVPINNLNQSFEEVPTHSSSVVGSAADGEVEQLRESVALLTAQCAQLDEANRAWQAYHHAQVQDFRSKLQDYVQMDENGSLESVADQIIEQISKERADSNDKFKTMKEEISNLNRELASSTDSMQQTYMSLINGINEELVSVKKQCEELTADKERLNKEMEGQSLMQNEDSIERSIDKVSLNVLKQPFLEVPTHTSSLHVEEDEDEIQQLQKSVAYLTDQCAQLDQANRAWQLYQHTQIQDFRSKLQKCFSLDENISFDAIAEEIIDQTNREREDFNQRYQNLENDLENLRSDMKLNIPSVEQSDMNTMNEMHKQLIEITEAYQKLDTEKQLLMKQLEILSIANDPKQTIERVSLKISEESFEKVPVHTSESDSREDVNELQKKIAYLTSQCAQLDEANSTWQRYERVQLDNFRNKLEDYIPMDESVSFDDVIHHIIERMNKDREIFKEKCSQLDRTHDQFQSEINTKMSSLEQSSTEYIDELNQELTILKNQNEELERMNQHLLLDKEELSSQLNDRSIVLGHPHLSNLNQIQEETSEDFKDNAEVQSASDSIHQEELCKIRVDLASITDQFNKLTETNRNDLNLFRHKLENWISLREDSTLDDIAQQLHDQFEQQQQQSIVDTNENQTQTMSLPEKIDIALQTTPLVYENRQTQIDPIEMIDQETQTESFQQLWSMSDDENLLQNKYDDENHLLDYIDEIYSLSPTDLTNRLNKECQQILTKKKIPLSSYENLQLNHYALMTIYLLYNQHLTDDAKQLYNEMMIRALRQEYELINNEKHDSIEKYNEIEQKYLNELNLNEKKMHQLQNKYDELLEHSELERFDAKKIYDDLIEKYELRIHQYEFNLYTLHQENENYKYELSNTLQDSEQLLEKDYDKLQSEYQQLRQDYNEIINENELLKDYNSQMYQRKLQGHADDKDPDELKLLHDIDIQCNLSDELQSSNTEELSSNNDSNGQDTSHEKLIQEQQLVDEDEINRLKSLISDIQRENENLKELNAELYQIKLKYTNADLNLNQAIIQSNDIDIQCLPQSITTASSVQAEIENEQQSMIPTIPAETEDNGWDNNDWNDEIPSIETLVDQPVTASVIPEPTAPITVDSQTQTDEQTSDKMLQINNKLKRALQTIKDRIHHFVIEQPELFSNTNDDTIERLDHLISLIRNQTTQINDLSDDYNQAQNKIHELQSSLDTRPYHTEDEHVTKTEELLSSPISIDNISQSKLEDSEKEIHQLQEKISQNDNERSLLRERLNEVELELHKVLDDHAATATMYDQQLQSVIQERDALVQQHILQSNESQYELEELRKQLEELKKLSTIQQSRIASEEEVNALHKVIEQQSEQLKQLNEQYTTLASSQVESEAEFDRQKKDIEERINNYETQINHLNRERDHLREEIQKNRAASTEPIEHEKKPDDKLSKVNTKLKRVLQTFKDKIHRIANERPDLFTNVGEETTERLDHLIATVEHQAVQIDLLQSEHEQTQEQLRNQIQDLQSSLDACKYQIENEHAVSVQQLVCAIPPSDDDSQSKLEDYEKEIHQLKEKISQNDDERSLLRERLNEVELELRKVLDDHAATTTMYDQQLQSVIQERDALVQQHILQSNESQQLINRLQEDLSRCKQTADSKHVDVPSSDDVKSLQEIIEQQSEELKDVSEKYFSLTSQLESYDHMLKQRDETDERLRSYENQIQKLISENANISQELATKTSFSISTTNNETQTDEKSQQHDKLTQVNHRLKRALQTMKDKIHRIVNERPELFNDIGEDTNERLDHLISIAEHQATELDQLKVDHISALTIYEEQLQTLLHERNALVEQQTSQSFDEQDKTKELKQLETTLFNVNEENQSLQETIKQQVQLYVDLNNKYTELNSSQLELKTEFDRQKGEIEQRINNYESQIDHLNRERDNLREEIQKNRAASTEPIEHEKQPDDKLSKVNTKLKRVLQTFKDKIHRIANERPDLFTNVGEETTERLDHLIATVEHQAVQIDILQSEHEQTQEQLRNQIQDLQSSLDACKYQIENEHAVSVQQLVCAIPPSDDDSQSKLEDYEKEIHQLKEKISQNDDERSLLRERLNEVELELRKVLDDHAATTTMYDQQLQSVIQERDALVQQHILQSNESQYELEELRKQLEELKELSTIQQSRIASEEEVNALHKVIEQQSEQLKQLNEQYTTLASSQVESEAEFDRQKKDIEERINNYETQINHLNRERDYLREEIQKNRVASTEPIEHETQPDDKRSKVNAKLKRVLQTFKDKIHRIANERPDLFTNVGEETTERLDHLIATVEHQAVQIDLLQSEHEQTQEQLRNQIQDLQSSLDACKYQIENERAVSVQQLVCAIPPSDDDSQSKLEDYEKEIHQLQEKISQNDNERSLLRERLNEVELELHKLLDDHAKTATMYDQQLQSVIQERDALVQQHILQSNESQYELEELRKQVDELKELSAIQQIRIASGEDVNALHKVIEQQSEQLNQLNAQYTTLASSQVESEAEFDRQKKDIEERINNYETQINHLNRELDHLREEIQKSTNSTIQIAESDKQKDDQQYDKLLKLNTKLKRVLQTFKDKIHRIASDRPELFNNVGEEASERLDHLITIIENQATGIQTLQDERNELEKRLQYEINELQNSFNLYKQEVDNDYRTKLNEYNQSSLSIIQKIESEPIEKQQALSNENQWNDWSVDAPITVDTDKQYHDIDIRCELLVDTDQSINRSTVSQQLSSVPKDETSLWSESAVNDWGEQNLSSQYPFEESAAVEHMISSSVKNQNLLEILKSKIDEIVSEYPELFPNGNMDLSDMLDQLILIIRNCQNQIKELQDSFNVYRYRIENEQMMSVNTLTSNDLLSSTFDVTKAEEYQKEIDELKEQLDQNNLIHQREIQSLMEERDQAREQLKTKENNECKSFLSIESQTSIDTESSHAESRLNEFQNQIDGLLRERISLMEQIKQLEHQPVKEHAEMQTKNDTESSSHPEQRVSRRVFEQELLAWSKESEQLKQFVKQIQIENKKLKDIILKFESIIQDYMHENELLKQENQHLSFLSYSSKSIMDNRENSTSSDTDICYLTLKWLTYEVAQRTSTNNNNNEQTSLIIDNDENYIKQRLHDNERQLKSVRAQNLRLKKQLETYTIQFKHIQHEMNIKIQELSTLKIEVDRLRTSEMQYRLEVDRLRADIQCNEVKFQQVDRELTDLKLAQIHNDDESTSNLRVLLELKERELNALKEKLDYTIQAHQLELQEAIKSNQFSLDNVQRFEQLDQRHQEKRKELETRLGKICKCIKPLINNRHLLKDNSIIDFDALQELITDTEAEERVINSLGPIRDCLGLLENQMKDLQHNLIENHARRSQRWKYKLGFECLSCESQWEVTHDIRDLQEACQDPTRFLESSRVEPMMSCSCPLIVDFIQNDVRLCIDDMLDEVVIRTTVK